MIKICYKCKIEKPINEFSKSKREKDGLQSSCKVCVKEYRQANKDRTYKYNKEYNLANKEEIVKQRIGYRLENKEKIAKYNKEYRLANKGKLNANANLRRCKQATPSWVDYEWMELIYVNCLEGYEVDHTLPINNKTVCGLNVPWNLQYLTKAENIKKRSKYDNTPKYHQ